MIVALILFAVTLPDTVKFVKVPSVVMFGWLPLVIVALMVLAVMLFATLKFCNPFRLVIFAVVELMLLPVILPFTVNALKLPRLVIVFSAV